MIALQNALNFIVNLNGVSVTIKRQIDLSDNVVTAAQSNYFRKPLIDEQVTGQGRSYVISAKDLGFIPKRGDTFTVSSTEYYGISDVQEMRALGSIIGYRLFVE